MQTHHRIDFGFFSSWIELFCFQRCSNSKKQKIIRSGMDKIKKEINVIKVVKMLRQMEVLMKVSGYDGTKSLLMERNVIN